MGIAHYVTKQVRTVDRKKTGANAREMRKSCGLILEQLADEMGCSIVWVSKLEQGQKNWSDQWIAKFEAACRKLCPSYFRREV